MNKRTTDFHRFVFHGWGYYHSAEADHRWRLPATTTSTRETYHVWRSGALCPPVFSPYAFTFLICREVREALMEFAGIEFTNNVEFEHVVDLPMPPVGTMPNPPYTKDSLTDLYDHVQFRQLLSGFADQPAMRTQFAGYSQWLFAWFRDLEADYPDVDKIPISFGSCTYPKESKTAFSLRILDHHPVYLADSGVLVMPEPIFETIAPYLDPDYYDIALLNLSPKTVFPWERPEEKERRRKLRQQREKDI
jgi:hypothetical protein